ncbi:MAG: ABC transporter substrate-binding protein [Candidatus Rokubacteria bacterium]|nr:ABC transporter substrate-binding protein [Candidatus Rokubacteria bacterium]
MREHLHAFAMVPAVTVALVLLVCPGAGAGPPTDTLRAFFDGVNRVLADPGTAEHPTERLTTVRTLVNGLVDFRGAAELALGREWRARTPAEQEEFVRLFADFLERAYVLRVAAKASVTGGVGVWYLGESVDGDVTTVRTAVATKSGDEMPLDYRMIRRGERWMVRDIAVEGVSVAANYRAQFDRLIQSASYPELVARMKTRTEPAPRESAAAVEPPPPAGRAEHAGAITEPGPATKEPPPVPAALAAAPSYWVQIGAFRNPSAAGRLVARLPEQHLVLSPGGESLVRVRVGPFADRADAVSKLRELQAKGYQPFIARSAD